LLLLAEYSGNPEMRKDAQEVWKNYLDGGNTEQKASWLNAAISISEGALEILHRATIRTGWSMRIGQLIGAGSDYGMYPEEATEHDVHGSEIVRAVVSGSSLFLDGAAIFGAMFLNEYLADGTEPPWKVAQLLRQVDRITANGNGAVDV